ncbi:hypothetical protein J5N97_011085 [Dioscorea zingiberensis]|uniref:Uncharacterized protein n=1 Tax=Dioscorea zingiberensis TaxID=325984 RepID=A0A9D5HN05_9LILI|nr:hypothetical protein J5N97_011085 [Dioscorea zingiberensis]
MAASGEQEEEVRLWSWGAGTEGQLSTGMLEDQLLPQCLTSLPAIAHIACGGAHAASCSPHWFIRRFSIWLWCREDMDKLEKPGDAASRSNNFPVVVP